MAILFYWQYRIVYRYVRRRGVGNPLLLAILHCLQIFEGSGVGNPFLLAILHCLKIFEGSGVDNPVLLVILHFLQICEEKGGWQSSSTGNTALSTDI